MPHEPFIINLNQESNNNFKSVSKIRFCIVIPHAPVLNRHFLGVTFTRKFLLFYISQNGTWVCHIDGKTIIHNRHVWAEWRPVFQNQLSPGISPVTTASIDETSTVGWGEGEAGDKSRFWLWWHVRHPHIYPLFRNISYPVMNTKTFYLPTPHAMLGSMCLRKDILENFKLSCSNAGS